MQKVTIHGVSINKDAIKSIQDLKAANLFGHLPNSSELEASAAIELGLKKEKAIKESPEPKEEGNPE